MSDVRTPDRKTCMKEAREGMMDNAMEELYENTTSLEIDFGKCSRLLLKHWPKLGTDTSRMPTPKQEARLLLSDDHQVVRFASGMRDFRDALMLVEQARETMAGALVHLSGIQGGAEIEAEADAVEAEASEEAGASESATKKRKIFSPLTGFKAAGYKAARVQTSGEGAAGGGVPVAEEEPKGVPGEAKKEIIMAGPWQPGEWSNWGKASHDLTADGRVVVGDDVKSAFEDLVESERLVGGIREKVASLSDVFDDDAHRVMERGLFECFGMERYPPRAPETRLRLHSSAAAEVRKARDALRALAFYAKEADAATRRAREAMNVEACENWLHLHAQ